MNKKNPVNDDSALSPSVVRVQKFTHEAKEIYSRLKHDGTFSICTKIMRGFGGCGEEQFQDIVWFLFQAAHRQLAIDFACLLFFRNPDEFEGTTELIKTDTEALWDEYEATYEQRAELSLDDAALYELLLTNAERLAFRIGHFLAMREDKRYPSPFFFLSANELKQRAGLSSDSRAWDSLQRLRKLTIICMAKKGDQRAKGITDPKATVWMWNTNR